MGLLQFQRLVLIHFLGDNHVGGNDRDFIFGRRLRPASPNLYDVQVVVGAVGDVVAWVLHVLLRAEGLVARSPVTMMVTLPFLASAIPSALVSSVPTLAQTIRPTRKAITAHRIAQMLGFVTRRYLFSSSGEDILSTLFSLKI